MYYYTQQQNHNSKNDCIIVNKFVIEKHIVFTLMSLTTTLNL